MDMNTVTVMVMSTVTVRVGNMGAQSDTYGDGCLKIRVTSTVFLIVLVIASVIGI
jgi:hypothetical protein